MLYILIWSYWNWTCEYWNTPMIFYWIRLSIRSSDLNFQFSSINTSCINWMSLLAICFVQSWIHYPSEFKPACSGCKQGSWWWGAGGPLRAGRGITQVLCEVNAKVVGRWTVRLGECQHTVSDVASSAGNEPVAVGGGGDGVSRVTTTATVHQEAEGRRRQSDEEVGAVALVPADGRPNEHNRAADIAGRNDSDCAVAVIDICRRQSRSIDDEPSSQQRSHPPAWSSCCIPQQPTNSETMVQMFYYENRGKCCKKLLRYNGYPNKVRYMFPFIILHVILIIKRWFIMNNILCKRKRTGNWMITF